MNITITEYHKKSEWQHFLLKNGEWNLFQSNEWGDVQSAHGERLWRWGIFADDKLIGIMQGTLIRAKRGRFLHVRHGPVIDYNYRLNNEVWKQIILTLTETAKKEGAWYMRVSPMFGETLEAIDFFKTLGFRPAPIHRMDAEVCWVLDLSPAEDMLLQNMRKTTRYLVRQADKMGVKIKTSQDIDVFFKLYALTAARHNFVQHQSIKEEFAIFGKNKQARLYIAEHEGKPLAAAIILYFGKQAIYHHGASIPTKVPASYRLQWQAILDAKRQGMRYYNFWGIAPADKPNHPWRGITLFKQGFGGQEHRFIHAQDLPLSPFYLVSYTIDIVRRQLRGY